MDARNILSYLQHHLQFLDEYFLVLLCYTGHTGHARLTKFGLPATAAGGAGWQLAEWIIDGEPTVDMMGVDPRRFGPYASRGYLRSKNEEAYDHVFKNHYPDEERGAVEEHVPGVGDEPEGVGRESDDDTVRPDQGHKKQVGVK